MNECKKMGEMGEQTLACVDKRNGSALRSCMYTTPLGNADGQKHVFEHFMRK